jgi:hypothetical protein
MAALAGCEISQGLSSPERQGPGPMGFSFGIPSASFAFTCCCFLLCFYNKERERERQGMCYKATTLKLSDPHAGRQILMVASSFFLSKQIPKTKGRKQYSPRIIPFRGFTSCH